MLHKKTTKQKKLCLPFLFNVVLINFPEITFLYLFSSAWKNKSNIFDEQIN